MGPRLPVPLRDGGACRAVYRDTNSSANVRVALAQFLGDGTRPAYLTGDADHMAKVAFTARWL